MNRMRLIMGLVLVALLAVPTVAYASTKIRFDAIVGLIVIGPAQALGIPGVPPMDTEATFKVKKTGEIKEVKVGTTNEFVTSTPAGIAVTGCEPIGSQFCADLQGATLTTLHDSKAELEDVTQVPGFALAPIDPSFAAFPDVLIGTIKGKLKGTVTIIGATPADVMVGTIKARIRSNPDSPPGLPGAVYGCIASLDPYVPLPLPISACQDGAGSLVPLFLNIQDSGNVKIKTALGAFGGVDEAKAKVVLTVLGADGVATLSGGAHLGDGGNSDSDDDD